MLTRSAERQAAETAGRWELLRALGTLAIGPPADTAQVARALDLPAWTAVEHTELFVLSLPPYASIHLGPDGKLTLWSSTQGPHYIHRLLAKILGMPAAHIRVIATPNGGGFGGKCDPGNHEFVVSKAALALGRPEAAARIVDECYALARG